MNDSALEVVRLCKRVRVTPVFFFEVGVVRLLKLECDYDASEKTSLPLTSFSISLKKKRHC
jgi:hypothetical protein